ncbi:MAG: acyltransferase [Variovorax sp.]
MPSTPDKHHFQSLDAARGAAALVVVLYHWENFSGQWFDSGFLAVDFFFGLSGFVLAHAYAGKLCNGTINARQFMVARVVRLYPLYLLGLLLLLAVLGFRLAMGLDLPWSTNAMIGKLPSAFLMLPSPSLDVRGFLYPFNIPAWSILFELLVNLFFAVFCRQLMVPRIRWTLIAVSGALLAIQLLGLGVEEGGPTWNTLAFGIPRVVFSFFVGVQLYEWHRRGGGPARATKRQGSWSLGALALLIACLIGPSAPLMHAFAIFFIFPALIWTLASSSLPSGRAGAALRELGVVSYALYMLHSSVGLLYATALQRWSLAPDAWPAAVIPLLVLLVVASWAGIRWFDRPVRGLLQRGLRAPGSSAVASK